MRPHPRYADTNPPAPRAWATCDRCGFQWQHRELNWQYDWRGTQPQNRRLLICPRCEDAMQRQLGILYLPPDPLPIMNARPENYTNDARGGATTITGLFPNARALFAMLNSSGNVLTNQSGAIILESAILSGSVAAGITVADSSFFVVGDRISIQLNQPLDAGGDYYFVTTIMAISSDAPPVLTINPVLNVGVSVGNSVGIASVLP